jgi:small GTP-binding protein
MEETCLEINTRAFKVILVGLQAVGKSSILCRLVNSQMPTSYQATVGIDYHSYSPVVNKKTFSLQIWDTAGQEKFRALTSTYFKNCSACICVYDLNDKESIIKTDYYLNKAN